MEQIVFLISVQYKPFFNTHDFKLPLMKCVVFVDVDLVSHVPQLSQNIIRLEDVCLSKLSLWSNTK